MRKLIVLFVLASMLNTGCTQINQLSMKATYGTDAVFLKDGSIIKGKIIEINFNESIKIELYGGSIMVFDYDKIERIEKVGERKKIIAMENLYFFQGGVYKYDKKGIAQLDSLFSGIPEAEFEMTRYKSNIKSSAILFVGLLLPSIALNRFGVVSWRFEYLFSCIPSGIMCFFAHENVQRAVAYYNMNLEKTEK